MIAADALLDVGAGLSLTAALFGLTGALVGRQGHMPAAFDPLFVTALAFILASLVVRLAQ